MMMMTKAPLVARIILFIVVSTLTTASQATANFSIAKKDCKDRCGDVEIPYPFGIDPGCYLDETFQIDCFTNYSSNLVVAPVPVPFYINVSSHMTVSSISLEEGSLELMSFISRYCYNKSGLDYGSSVLASFTIPFSGFTLNATSNKFVTIGCDDLGIYTGSNSTGGKISRNGCISYCNSVSDVRNDVCNGIGCCEAEIPDGQSVLNMTLTTFNNHSLVLEDNPCSYAFLIATKHFNFSKTNLTDLRTVDKLPTVVDWVIGNTSCDEARKNLTSYACKGNDTVCVDHLYDDDIGGYRCHCRPGFEGNPYLALCTDIDECAHESLHNCVQESVCINTVGNYTCDCKKGYEGDGKKEEGCKRRAKDTSKYYKIVSGISVGVVFILVVGCLLYSENRRRNLQQAREKYFRDNGGVLLQNQLSSNESGHSTKIFSIDELKKASNNFDVSRVVGEGGFGTVYKGYLPDNAVIAIKKSKAIDRNQIDSFINEVLVLSQINHRNVVKLLGCCLETEIPLLVYEFVDNETLSEHIHDIQKSSILSFQMRLKIAAESAGVLSYLHSAASPPIIHRDIKSANILLDKNYTAKVADFGISKINMSDQTQISTVVQGTVGYLDPEYLQTNQLTEKSDVYSFGVLLIELFTGKKALCYERPEEERSLARYFLTKLSNDTLSDIIDFSISNDKGTKESLDEIAILAKRCVNIIGEQRPTMKEVAMELEGMRMMKCIDFNMGKNVEEMEPFLIEGPSDSYIYDVNSITNASCSNEGMSELFYFKSARGR